MAEYIEREHLKDKFTRYLNAPHVRGGYSVGQGMRVAIKTCIAMLDEEPTAEVEPVTFTKFNHCRGKLVCGNCGWTFAWSEPEMPYCCPFCGARNDGGADNG